MMSLRLTGPSLSGMKVLIMYILPITVNVSQEGPTLCLRLNSDPMMKQIQYRINPAPPPNINNDKNYQTYKYLEKVNRENA